MIKLEIESIKGKNHFIEDIPKRTGNVKVAEPHAFLEFVRTIHNKIPTRIVLNTFFFKYFLELLKDCARHKGKIIDNHAPA
tara:strand:+ start:501 stop:743 length:243 start_codon:yes stop_codon:yes gene_type:complete